MRAAVIAAGLALLSACSAPPEVPQRGTAEIAVLPAMKIFPPARARPPQRGNAGIARDILALEFQLESGRDLPRLTRFSGPVTITLTGDIPATAPGELTRLVARLRAEAGIDISTVPEGRASITVEFLPRRVLQALVPDAACFVVPNVSDWAAYRAARRTGRVDWATLTERTTAAVFIPNDVAPQEIRDCLHEEVAQALGPLNDLYQLSDSVFNDDNFHTVLTGFDMLVLKVHYAPELANGMTRAGVEARLPAVLARLHPAGGNGGILPPSPTPRAWISAIDTALGPRGTPGGRRVAAQKALDIARTQGWTDARLAFSWFALGRLSRPDELDLAVRSLNNAAAIYRTVPGAGIQLAHVDMQMAAFALGAGQPQEAIRLADRAQPAAVAAQNAALLASLLTIRAEALELQGNRAAAQALRLDSLGWARYGFGTEDAVTGQLAGIALLAPQPGG
jgi:hypothetical protein